MSRNFGASNSREVYLRLLPYWRELKLLPIGSQQYLDKKLFLFHEFIEDIKENADSFQRRHLPKKSLVDADDVWQSVQTRMWEEMDHYDPERGIEFRQYFNSHINNRLRGAIYDEMRRMQNFPRKHSPKLRNFNGKMKALQQILGKVPSVEDYLDYYGWHLLTEVNDPLLFSQVFNQSNTRPGEHLEDELRFEGDRRRRQREPEISMSQAIQEVKERISCQAEILDLLPNRQLQTVFAGYHFWDWNIITIAEATGFSPTLISKRKKQAERIIRKAFTRDEFKQFMESGKVNGVHHKEVENKKEPEQNKSTFNLF